MGGGMTTCPTCNQSLPIRDIGEAVGLSSFSTVHAHLRILQRQKRVVWEPTLNRTIRVVTPQAHSGTGEK